eukprot:175724-Chlamydomonas_euryale.AAC.1
MWCWCGCIDADISGCPHARLTPRHTLSSLRMNPQSEPQARHRADARRPLTRARVRAGSRLAWAALATAALAAAAATAASGGGGAAQN